jgi:rhamnosyltransferase
MSIVMAITVTYHPLAEVFAPLLEKLIAQTSRVIVVDNTPGEPDTLLQTLIADSSNPNCCLIMRMGENVGIARAINVGVECARGLGADFVLLSDQDSLPADDMVENLYRAYLELTNQGLLVGAVGPTFTDLHTGLTYPFQVKLPGHFFYGHKAAAADAPHVEALTLITSGTLIPVSVLQEVGLMREDFFIDQVDIEWCHRARWKGFHLFGTGWAAMSQRMGEAQLRVWYLRWRNESAYSPLRIYYRLRNFVALWKLDFIDWRWKVRSSWYYLGIVFTHVFFGRQRLETLRMAAKGIWHGLLSRMGGYPE